jgi:GTP-binding protein
MGHPAHFYLYKNSIINWRAKGHQVEILIKKKGNAYIVEGKKVEELIAKINTTTIEGMNKVLSILNKLGMEDKLRAKGIQNGDTVKIGDVEFEYFE